MENLIPKCLKTKFRLLLFTVHIGKGIGYTRLRYSPYNQFRTLSPEGQVPELSATRPTSLGSQRARTKIQLMFSFGVL